MDLPFNLMFKQFDKVIIVSRFWALEWEVDYEEHVPCITENMDLAVLFDSPDSHAKLYMEGLEVLSLKETESDEEGVFLRPTHEYMHVFDSKKAESYSPFIPGSYLIKVKCEGKYYYSAFRITTKQMTTEEWQLMKDEIELLIPGFTYDNEKKGRYIKEKTGLKAALKDRHIYGIFQDVIERPKVSISFARSHSHVRREQGRSRPVKEVTYNTIENQWLKVIMEQLLQGMNRGAEKEDDSEIEIKQMRAFLQHQLQHTWLRNIERRMLQVVPSTFLMDYRYKAIYDLYRKMDEEPEGIRHFIVKRTDLLYETWCYLQMIHVLTSPELGYEIENGWNNPYTQALKSMEEGTTVAFIKGDIHLRLVYDQVIPYESRQTNECCPIYTSGQHNRPDTRMDIYMKEMYCGSIIIDYKYRPLKHIWDATLLRSRKPNRVMIQMDSYKSQIRSVLLGKGENRYQRLNPVTEVWIVFPRGDISTGYENVLEDYGIRLLKLKPNNGDEDLKDSLIKAIEKTIAPFLKNELPVHSTNGITSDKIR